MGMIRSKQYLAHVRNKFPCMVTGDFNSETMSVDPAHVRMGLGGGMAMKPSDDRVLPLRHDLHVEQHARGEHSFWLEKMEDRQVMARFLCGMAKLHYLTWLGGLEREPWK